MFFSAAWKSLAGDIKNVSIIQSLGGFFLSPVESRG